LKQRLKTILQQIAALPVVQFETKEAFRTWLGAMPLRAQLDWVPLLPFRSWVGLRYAMSLEGWCAMLQVPFKDSLRQESEEKLSTALRKQYVLAHLDRRRTVLETLPGARSDCNALLPGSWSLRLTCNA
jgi:hypothetical protein